MKKIFSSIFMVLFFILGVIGDGYPCTGVAYIDDEKSIAWINFDRPEPEVAFFCEIKPFLCNRVKGFSRDPKLREEWISHGMNQHALAILTQSPPNEEKCPNRKYYRPAGDWLKKFRTVDEALAEIEKKKAFHLVSPLFRILADRNKIALIEAYSPEDYKIVTLHKGVLTHTNHYAFPELSNFNEKLNAKPGNLAFSEKRLRIANDFLEKKEKTVEAFKELSFVPSVSNKLTIANIIFYIPHNDEKPKVMYRFPNSQDKDWVEVGF
jgi:hypothetical protein